MDPLLNFVLVATVAIIAGFSGYAFHGLKERYRRTRAEEAAGDEASRILSRAEKEAENLRATAILNGKEEILELREAWKHEELRNRKNIDLSNNENNRQSSRQPVQRLLENLKINFPEPCP